MYVSQEEGWGRDDKAGFLKVSPLAGLLRPTLQSETKQEVWPFTELEFQSEPSLLAISSSLPPKKLDQRKGETRSTNPTPLKRSQ